MLDARAALAQARNYISLKDTYNTSEQCYLAAFGTWSALRETGQYAIHDAALAVLPDREELEYLAGCAIAFHETLAVVAYMRPACAPDEPDGWEPHPFLDEIRISEDWVFLASVCDSVEFFMEFAEGRVGWGPQE